MSLRLLLSCNLLATLRYLFLSNSASSDLIWAAVKAVRGRFFRSSSLVPHPLPGLARGLSSPATLLDDKFVPLLLVQASAKQRFKLCSRFTYDLVLNAYE